MAKNARIQSIERATNRSWDAWLAFMDGIDAQNLTHHEIATKLLEELDGTIDNPAWWAQSAAVAYEQQSWIASYKRFSSGFRVNQKKATEWVALQI